MAADANNRRPEHAKDANPTGRSCRGLARRRPGGVLAAILAQLADSGLGPQSRAGCQDAGDPSDGPHRPSSTLRARRRAPRRRQRHRRQRRRRRRGPGQLGAHPREWLARHRRCRDRRRRHGLRHHANECVAFGRIASGRLRVPRRSGHDAYERVALRRIVWERLRVLGRTCHDPDQLAWLDVVRERARRDAFQRRRRRRPWRSP